MSKLTKSFCLLLSLFGFLTGCNSKEQPENVTAEPLLPTAGMMTNNINSNDTEDTNELPQNPLHKSLIGSFWRFEEFDMRFLDANHVHIKGGVVNKLSPEGIEAEYKLYDDGILEIMVLGMIKTGMWDGKKLVIDGLIGTKKE
ncbi:MAG TPA: hypothetical protein PLT82_08545 [Candidatus Hydrogenedens sp.]|nr:hypothetical protein [Candidatus Hydrogenedens sp.]HOK08244.1 hypothetical protein [Candidatus Hydrogenedens sp.]HOL20000.1 hypothetical protein [Candidatus Hydrogenedens sp.]HPP59165.1 hypothetical protein [Candidatus Hydrogenedens sp.]